MTGISLTVTPDEGFELGSISVTSRFGSPIELVKTSENVYTFAMPVDNVLVTASFTKMEEPEVPEEPEFPFMDVPVDSYYYDAVVWAVKEGITDGTTPTTFSPELDCTRGQMVTFLWRVYN